MSGLDAFRSEKPKRAVGDAVYVHWGRASYVLGKVVKITPAGNLTVK